MKKTIFYLATAIIILVIAVLTWQYVKQSSSSSKSSKEDSILVLPLSIDSTDKQDEYLADGLLSGIIDNLAKTNELKVMSKTTSNQFKDSNQSPIEITKLLGVNYVLEGSFKTINDSVEMQVRLLDETGDQICSETYIGSKSELLEITSRIQRDITETIKTLE